MKLSDLDLARLRLALSQEETAAARLDCARLNRENLLQDLSHRLSIGANDHIDLVTGEVVPNGAS